MSSPSFEEVILKSKAERSQELFEALHFAATSMREARHAINCRSLSAAVGTLGVAITLAEDALVKAGGGQ